MRGYGSRGYAAPTRTEPTEAVSYRVSSFSLSFVGGMAYGYISPYFPLLPGGADPSWLRS